MSEMLMPEANQTNEGSEQQQPVDTVTSEQTTETQQQAETQDQQVSDETAVESETSDQVKPEGAPEKY